MEAGKPVAFPDVIYRGVTAVAAVAYYEDTVLDSAACPVLFLGGSAAFTIIAGVIA